VKRLLVLLVLFSASTMLCAKSLNCQNLGITIANTSAHDCKLRATSLFYGALFTGGIPGNIPSGTISKVFYMQQDGYGIGIQLDYRCDDKVVVFYSGQNYCNLSAGKIGGWPYIGNDLGLEHHETMGSYWSGVPGQISWKIY
jgi:hypothetical protein